MPVLNAAGLGAWRQRSSRCCSLLRRSPPKIGGPGRLYNKTVIEVTPNAVGKIRKMLTENDKKAMRLGIVGGGCSGLSYKFKYETTARETDNVIEVDGVQLFVDPKSYKYLDGMILDYEETILEQAFRFINPNAQKSCGCGRSFQV